MRDPKNLTEWLQLDYFRRPRPLRVLRRRATWLTLGLFTVLMALGLARGNRLLYQAGPLSQAHAMFNENCAACHTQAFLTARRLLPYESETRSVTNEACQSCHVAPEHNKQEVFEPDCVSCHREHRGRFELSVVKDQECTVCHRELQRHDEKPAQYKNVSSFPGGHPEFKLFRDDTPKDPGTLKFNHQFHLAAEGVPAPGGKMEKLNCESCHVADSRRRYMVPVKYNEHCSRCHPLNVQVTGSFPTPASKEAAEAFSRKPAPHKEPELVQAELRQRFTNFFRAYSPQAGPPPERLVPGMLMARAKEEEVWVEGQLRESERALFAGGAGCRHCHPAKTNWEPGQQSLPVYELTNVPTRWFKHSEFSHDSHRILRCDQCHPGVAETSSAQTVIMPKLETCAQCHHPRAASSDCIECHRYHSHRPDKLQGKQTIAECLTGEVKQ